MTSGLSKTENETEISFTHRSSAGFELVTTVYELIPNLTLTKEEEV